MLPLHTQKSLDQLTWNEVQKLHSALGLKATAEARTRRDYQRRIVEAQPQPIAHTDIPAPATFTCAQCPFARLIDPDSSKYCCQVAQTASDVRFGHWEATISCVEALAAAEAEATKPEAPIAPEEIPTEVEPTPAVCSEESELPNRGDNGRGRTEMALSQPVKIAALPHAAKPKADDNFMSSMVKEDNFDREFYDLAYLSEQQLKAQLAVEKTVIGSEGEAIALLHLAKIDRDIEFYGRTQPELQPSPVVIQLEKQMTELKKDVLSLFKITAFDPAIMPTETLDEQPAVEIEPEGTIKWETPFNGTIVGKRSVRRFWLRAIHDPFFTDKNSPHDPNQYEIRVAMSDTFSESERRKPNNIRIIQIREAIKAGRTFDPKAFKNSPQFLTDTENYRDIGRIVQGLDGRWWAFASTGITGHPFFSRELAENYLNKTAERHQFARQSVTCTK